MISNTEQLINHDIRSHNPFIKTCKTSFIQSVINELSKLNLENSNHYKAKYYVKN